MAEITSGSSHHQNERDVPDREQERAALEAPVSPILRDQAARRSDNNVL
jgi:hypothetical protein